MSVQPMTNNTPEVTAAHGVTPTSMTGTPQAMLPAIPPMGSSDGSGFSTVA